MSVPIIISTINLKAPINSPAFTGEPTAPTPASGDSSTKLATTAFLTNTETLTKYVKKSGDSMTGSLTNNASGENFIVQHHQLGNVCTLARDASGADLYGIYNYKTNSWALQMSTSDNILNGIVKNNTVGGTYVAARDNAAIRLPFSTSVTAFAPVFSAKTQLGEFSMGVLHPNEKMVVNYVSDTDYNAGTNSLIGSLAIDSGCRLWGAVWNDYAEFRSSNSFIEPGRCVIEAGDDTLILATERMQPGANIVSDTFGFSIGHNDEKTEDTQLPIAVSGRVLAYGYEDLDEFRANIGRPVCSGPNGTVSIMTDEEYRDRGYCAIGTISAIPEYEEWGTGKIKVNGRIWIKVI